MPTALEKTQQLRNRTSQFGVSIIKFCKQIKITSINRAIIDQLIRSSTSVGANYSEATNASSRKDFRNKMFIAKKELQETKH